MSDLVDSRGCLTPAGFQALGSATPGQAPPELAAHVASCHRCQQRMLFGEDAQRKAAAERKPLIGWVLAIVFAGLLAALLGLLTVHYLTTAPP